MSSDIITENIDSKAYSDAYIKELKYKDIVVDSLEDALQLAESYKESGKYNWFRGQTGLWPLIPSTNRLNDKERNKAEEKLKEFDNWASINNLFTDLDSSEAIAQHFELQTMFIDFSTDPKVAAYFASDKANYKEYKYSCIYCLNTEDFNNSFEDIKKLFPNLPNYPRLVDIEVDNLWRLEAQEGKFMYQPIINLDWFYSLHRIVFKVKENDIQLFDESYIYPESKSVLEEKIDRFFYYEKQKNRIKNLKELVSNFEEIEYFEVDNALYIKEFIADEKIFLEYKWECNNVAKWENKTIEKYKDIYTTEKVLFKIKSFENIDINKSIIYEQLVELLNKNKDIRKKAINLSIIDNEKNLEFTKKFEKYSNIIWNGMRKLPYENEEIAKVISDIVQILYVSIYEYKNLDKNFIEIGFSDITGVGNRAFANKVFLFEAMRDDLNEFVVKETKDIRTIMYHIRSPQLLYKFESLKKLFVDSIIISQVVYGGNDFVIFSPMELKLFGLP